MALTISTGFVVDDAIVVIENVTRHLEMGLKPMQAALKGAREVGFTVLFISVSLVVVFIPILLMGGIVARLFREFAVVLSTAILVSLVVSLTTTPMMCSRRAASQTGGAWKNLSLQRKDFYQLARCLRKKFDRRAAASGDHADNAVADHRVEHLPVRHRAERIFPAAGQRHDFRRHSRLAGRLVSVHAIGGAAFCADHHE